MAMKRMMVVFLFIIPCLCFGQGTVNVQRNLEFVRRNTTLNIPQISNPYFIIDSVKRKSLDLPVNFVHKNTIKGSLYPLYVLNDLPMDIDFDSNSIDIQTIDSIDVLKDQMATAIYGSRGEKGSIFIYTKDYLQKKKEESVVYEITVLDPGYETFLLMQKPKEFYSASSLKIQNAMMVSEWNYRYSQPLHYNPDIYEVKIDYEANRYYGLEFEYRLYMFFKFMEKEHRIAILNDSQTTVL